MFVQNQVGSPGSFCSQEAGPHPQAGALPGRPDTPPRGLPASEFKGRQTLPGAASRPGLGRAASGRPQAGLLLLRGSAGSSRLPPPHLPALFLCPRGLPTGAAGLTPELAQTAAARPRAQCGSQGGQDTGPAWAGSSDGLLQGPGGFRGERVCVAWGAWPPGPTLATAPRSASHASCSQPLRLGAGARPGPPHRACARSTLLVLLSSPHRS